MPLTLQVKGRADASGKFVNSGLHIHTQKYKSGMSVCVYTGTHERKGGEVGWRCAVELDLSKHHEVMGWLRLVGSFKS